MPQVATVRNTIDSATLCANAALRIRKTPPISAGIAACRRRSPVLRECDAFHTIAKMAVRYGMAVSTPICSGLRTPDARMIDGSQNASP